jgi:hypothetical protein
VNSAVKKSKVITSAFDETDASIFDEKRTSSEVEIFQEKISSRYTWYQVAYFLITALCFWALRQSLVSNKDFK